MNCCKGDRDDKLSYLNHQHEHGGLISPTGTPREHVPRLPKKPKEPEHGPPVLPRQPEVYEFYHSQKIQVGVAVLIVMNFIFSCAEKEFDPYPTDIQKHRNVWKIKEDYRNLTKINN